MKLHLMIIMQKQVLVNGCKENVNLETPKKKTLQLAL